MGYIVVIALIVVLAALLIAGLVSKNSDSQQGRRSGARVVGATKPSADEPTPAASKVAPPQQAQRAQRHTPAA